MSHISLRGDAPSLTSYTQADGLPPSSIYAVHQNHDGTIWVGTLNGGLSHLTKGRFNNYTTASGLVSNTIRSIAEGANETMWFATPLGLSSFAQNRWTNYGIHDGLPSENVYTLFEDSTKVLWIGTLHGLAYVHSGRVLTPTGLPPSLLGQVFGITQNRAGSLWVSTSDGVLRVNRDKLLSGSLSNGDVREFGVSDGLRDARGVRRERSVATDLLGRIWFSSTDGLVTTNPERTRRTAVSTIAHIDGLSVDGDSQDLHKSVLLPPNSKRIVIEYARLNLSSPDHVRYRFKLDGFDHTWTGPVTGKEAVYTNLSPGAYRFRVMASNADQVWNGAEAELLFNVDPALWQTSWFQFICVLVALLTAGVLYRLRLHQMTEQVKVQFETRLAERTRIARNLHDTLLQSFHGLMLRFQAVQNMLPDQPAQAKQSLEIAIDRAARAITEGRDAIQELRSTEVSDALIDTLTSLGKELALSEDGKNATSYRVLLKGTPRQLHPRLQDDLYRISREAVANAYRHAHATHIELDIRYGARMLRCEYETMELAWIRRFWPKVAETAIRAFLACRSGPKAIRGRLEIWSELSRGTEIELTIPAHVAYMRLKRSTLSRDPEQDQ